MSDIKKRNPLHRTPAGVALYPRLNAPDFKYKAEAGEYSVKLRLTAAEAAPLKKLITEATEADYRETCRKAGKPKLKRSLAIPFKDETNDLEEPTGFVVFGFKLPGQIKSRKTDEIIKLKPALFDKAGNPITDEVWGGSTLKVAFEMRPYYTDGLGHGMTLQVKAVQVLTLVTRGEGGTAERYGFEVEKDETEEAPSVEEEAPNGQTKAKGDF